MATPKAPIGLRARGKRTWKAMASEDMTPEQHLLLEECCRSADRLDEIDALLRGKGSWFELAEQAEASGQTTIIIDKALAEVRQQQTVFKQLLVTFRQLVPGAKPQERGSRGAYSGSPSTMPVKDEVSDKRNARGWRSA